MNKEKIITNTPLETIELGKKSYSKEKLDMLLIKRARISKDSVNRIPVAVKIKKVMTKYRDVLINSKKAITKDLIINLIRRHPIFITTKVAGT